MSYPTDDLEDIWAHPSPPYSPPPPTTAPRSRQPWIGYEPADVQIARLQEAVAHLQEMTRTDIAHLQVVFERIQGMDARIRKCEDDQRESIAFRAKAKPILDQYQRLRDRIRWAKDCANWIAAGVTIYLAISGKISWGDVLHVLGRIFAAG